MLDAAIFQPVALPHQAARTAHDRPNAPSGCRHTHEHTWHVVATKPRAERIAHAALHHRGYAPYLPLNLGKPLFPGYCFCQLGPGQPWYPIAWAPGVYSLLSTDGKPNIVARAVVEALQATDELRATQPPKSGQWRSGAAVRVARGIFAGHPGVVTAVDHEAVSVAVLFLGQLRNVALSTDSIVARGDS